VLRRPRGSGLRARFRHRPPRRSAPATPRDAGGARRPHGYGVSGLGARRQPRGAGVRVAGRAARLLGAHTDDSRARGPARHEDPARHLGALSPRPVPARAALGARPPPRPRLGLRCRLGGPLGRPPLHWPRSFQRRARDWWASAFLPGAASDWLAGARSPGPGRCRQGLRRPRRRRRRARRESGELWRGSGREGRRGGAGAQAPLRAAGAGAAAGPGGVANGRGLPSAPRTPRPLLRRRSPRAGRARRRRTFFGAAPRPLPLWPRPLCRPGRPAPHRRLFSAPRLTRRLFSAPRPAAPRPPPARTPGSPLRPGVARARRCRRGPTSGGPGLVPAPGPPCPARPLAPPSRLRNVSAPAVFSSFSSDPSEFL